MDRSRVHEPVRERVAAGSAERPVEAPAPEPSDSGGNADPGPEQLQSVDLLLTKEIPRLRRYARLLVRDFAYADDLVQECLVRAVSKFHTYTPGTNLRAWLFVILRNVLINDYNRGQRGPVFSEIPDSHANLAVSGGQEQHLMLQEVREALDRLPDDQKEIILLVPVEGLSYEEVADVLSLPIGTVRSRLSRARAALRDAMGAGTPGDGGEV